LNRNEAADSDEAEHEIRDDSEHRFRDDPEHNGA
jgi:hypothetical protein